MLRFVYRAKRQFQKLGYCGKCDLLPGHWVLGKHLQAKTRFSSNLGLDKP